MFVLRFKQFFSSSYAASDKTIGNVLKKNGNQLSKDRTRDPNWSEFIKSNQDVLAVCDCFIYHENKLVARNTRSYDRRKNFELPDHPKALLAQRKSKEQKIYMRFLSLSEKVQDYYRQLEQRRMNSFHNIQKIVSLNENISNLACIIFK